MTTPIRNIAELRALRRRLVELRGVGRVVAARVAPRFTALARSQFDARESPSGAAWKPSKKTGKVPTLHRSGRLEQAATTFLAIGSTIRASIAGVRYARFQHPSRFLPSGKKLSPARTAIVEEVAEQEIRRALAGAA